MSAGGGDAQLSLEQVLTELGSEGPLLPAALLCRAAVHELKNGLNPLNLQLALLRRRIPEDERTSAILEGLRRSINDVDSILIQLQAFGHDAAPAEHDDARVASALERIARALHRGADGLG